MGKAAEMPVVEVRGKVVGGGGLPLICSPLVGTDLSTILTELGEVLAQKPDLVEWRADFFTGIKNRDEVLRVARRIRQTAAEVPVLFTVRSASEGGQPIPLAGDERVQLYRAVCRAQCVDMVDFELSSEGQQFRLVGEASLENGIKLIGSFHDFSGTPDPDVIKGKFAQAERVGADIVKVAVMPRNLEDVLTLLGVTLEAKNTLKIPLITVSMGGYGSLSRMFGWVFGSSLTFARGKNSSAPGQVSIKELKTVLTIVQKALGGDRGEQER